MNPKMDEGFEGRRLVQGAKARGEKNNGKQRDRREDRREDSYGISGEKGGSRVMAREQQMHSLSLLVFFTYFAHCRRSFSEFSADVLGLSFPICTYANEVRS